ncbi:MAG TPA: hypothetical protein VFF53_06380 [Geobacteraceae bacterium]|nr:hypothetical protein [Geobacteraceae bacterium]
MRTSSSRILLLAAAIGLSACASKESTLVKPVGDDQHPAAVDSNRQQVSLLRRKVVPLLEKKNYHQAIELMNDKSREGLEREYILAVNGLLEVGNDAYSSGNYAAAARSFKWVLDAYPVEPALRDRVSHDPKRIRALMEVCINRMMEQGLEEYRRGRLESAISKWKVLLAIRPGHQEAKKALDTATVQLQTLQGIKDR